MSLLERVRRELSKSLAKRGVLGTLRFGCMLIAAWLEDLVPGRQHRRGNGSTGTRVSTDSFDQRFGVDTEGNVQLGALRIGSTNWIYGQQYEPIAPPDFQYLLAPTGVDIPSATFVDLGSGKGRAVLLAARLPFKRVVGVEFSEELNLIAEENLRRFPQAEKRCADVVLMPGDAANFMFPAGPLVIYLYNPFEIPVMQHVVANLRAAYQVDPRPVVVLYFTPLHVDLWKALEFLEQTVATDDVAVLVSRESNG